MNCKRNALPYRVEEDPTKKKKGNHKWGFPSWHQRCQFTLSGADKRLGISLVATSDQRFTALDPCRLLKKAGENF